MTLADVEQLDAAETVAGMLRQAGYTLTEMPADADDATKIEALTGAVGVLAVVNARQAEQLDALTDLVGKLGELYDALAPMAEQLAAGGPGGLLSLLAGRRS